MYVLYLLRKQQQMDDEIFEKQQWSDATDEHLRNITFFFVKEATVVNGEHEWNVLQYMVHVALLHMSA
jgi:hypothetical protein